MAGYYTEVKNKALNWQIVSNSSEVTETIGQKLGSRLRGGEVIELVSDLGGGKTTFVRGIARGLGSQDAVASPTFTISRQYRSGELTLYHFDFYRLGEPGIVAAELVEVIGDPKAIVVIEWGEIVENILPVNRLTVTFRSTGEAIRQLIFEYPSKLNYLVSKEV
jgi:tRNA threonylcarbamoyladenosine biosynthesis protein TsaE